MSALLENPAVVAIVLALIAAVPALLTYKLGSKNDGEAAEVASTAQVYAGYGGLLQHYQNDNRDERLRREAVETENRELRRKLAVAENDNRNLRQQLADCVEGLGKP